MWSQQLSRILEHALEFSANNKASPELKSTDGFVLFADLLYRQTLTINNSALEVEIVDVSSCDISLFPEEAVYWADACVVVYDITNRTSFMQASELLQKVQQLRSQISVVLLGNKSDLEHLRQVNIEMQKTLREERNAIFNRASTLVDNV